MKDSTKRKLDRLVGENVHSMRAEAVREELTKIIDEAVADALDKAKPATDSTPEDRDSGESTVE